MTDAERLLWRSLRLNQFDGFKFRRQFPVGLYIVDFVCLECRLILEIDGGQHMERAEEDSLRTAWLESQDFRVIRFWNHEVMTEIEAVKKTIWDVLHSKAPPTLTLPRKGGGKSRPSSREKERSR
jgi:very-short-patch-repair endonuclease